MRAIDIWGHISRSWQTCERALRVCYLALLSRLALCLLSCFRFSSFLLSHYERLSLLLSSPPRRLFISLLLSLSVLYRLEPGRSAGQVEPGRAALGDRATNTRGELCLPFVKILDVSLIGMSGGSRAYPEEKRRRKKKKDKSKRACTKIRGTFDRTTYAANLLTAHNDRGRTERNLLSKRSQSRERNRARKLRPHAARYIESLSVC